MARCCHWRQYDLGSHRVATKDGKWSFLSIHDVCQGRSAFSGAAVCSPSLGQAGWESASAWRRRRDTTYRSERRLLIVASAKPALFEAIDEETVLEPSCVMRSACVRRWWELSV